MSFFKRLFSSGGEPPAAPPAPASAAPAARALLCETSFDSAALLAAGSGIGWVSAAANLMEGLRLDSGHSVGQTSVHTLSGDFWPLADTLVVRGKTGDGSRRTAVYDATSATERWASGDYFAPDLWLEETLCIADGQLLVRAVEIDANKVRRELVVRLDPATGARSVLLRVENGGQWRFLSAAMHEGLVVLHGGDRALWLVELASGELRAKVSLATFAQSDELHPLLAWRGICLPVTVDSRRGTVTRYLGLDVVKGTLEPRLELDGFQLAAVSSGRTLLARLRKTDGKAVLHVVTPGATREGERQIEIAPFAQNGEALAAADGWLAIVAPGRLDLFADSAAGLVWRRGPLPAEVSGRAIFARGKLCLMTAGRLLALDLDSLPPAVPGGDEPQLFDLRIDPGEPKARLTSSEPGTVVFAGESILSVDHPQFGRLTLRPEAGHGFKASDQILFDEVKRLATGNLQVKSWRRASDPPPPPRAVEPIVLTRDRIAPAAVTQTASRVAPERQPPQQQQLAALAQRFSMSPPPLLVRVAALYDSDPVFRQRFNLVAFELSMAVGSDAWDGADPCLAELGHMGNGDIYAFYLYPPAAGATWPLVDWSHETNEVTWHADDFDSFLASCLHGARDESGPSVALLLEQLGLPADWPRPARPAPPDWFLAAHPNGGEWKAESYVATAEDRAALVAAEARQDWLALERQLVRMLDQDHDDVRERLLALYAQLGWDYALGVLQSQRPDDD